MFVKGQKKLGGRKKGTPNKLTRDVQQFIDDVLTHEEATETAKKLIRSGDQKTVAIFIKLMEYRFGKPKETVEHKIDADIVERLISARKRVAPDEPK